MMNQKKSFHTIQVFRERLRGRETPKVTIAPIHTGWQTDHGQTGPPPLIAPRPGTHIFTLRRQPRNKEPAYMPCSVAVLRLLLMLMIVKQKRCTNYTPLESRTRRAKNTPAKPTIK